MIRLSSLDGRQFVLNCELIKTLEATPDTVIGLISGEKLRVCESVAEVVRRTIEFKRALGPGMAGAERVDSAGPVGPGPDEGRKSWD